MKKVLLHCCCAPCSVSCVEPLRKEKLEPVAFWYSPNIHPWKEYEARRNCLIEYAGKIDMELFILENYGLRDFVQRVAADIENRCALCYAMRLEAAAKYASENGFFAFTSTLLASTYQNHELIKSTAEHFAKQYGVEFLYRDFRPGFRDGNQKARELGLYMQKYCGCIFSEEDRYMKQISASRERFSCK